MITNEYSLQLLHHEGVFDTRESAVQYINEEFKNKSLLAEPAVVFYGDAANPNLIIAIGSADRKVFLIDTARLEEQIAEAASESAENGTAVDEISAALRQVVEEVGLVWDENKKSNQITYEPDSRDELLRNAETLAEAVSVISQYVQEQFKANNITIKDSDTVTLTFADAAVGGKELSAKVKVSEYGTDDELKFNDNILGVKNDGLYAAVNLSYDETTHRLTFTKSGMRNGRFVDDANVQVVDLGEHKQYVADNTDHTVKIVTDTERNTISADVKLSDSANNILTAQDGKLLVDGRASNIIYKDSNVFAALNKAERDIEALNGEVEHINDTHLIDGSESDTIKITTTKGALGDYRVSGDVRLGGNKSIKVIEGGLEVDLEITSDLSANQLVIRLGNTEKKINLPGIQVLSDVRYDTSNRSIVISTTDGKQFTIPVGDLISTWVVENDSNCPIVLNKTTSTASNPDTLSASLKISTKSGNIIGIDEQGRLMADASAINNKIENEIIRAQAAEKTNADAITDHIVEVNQKVADIAEAAGNMKAELLSGVNAVDDKVIALTERVSGDETSISNLETAVAGVNTQISEINTDLTAVRTNVALNKATSDTNKAEIETIKTKVGGIQDRVADAEHSIAVHEANYNALKTVAETAAAEVAANKTAVTDEVARATEAEGILRTDISLANNEITRIENKSDHIKEDLEGAIDAEVEARKAADILLKSQLDEISENMGGGVDNALQEAKAYTDAEVARYTNETNNAITIAKRDAIDDSKEYADTKVADAAAEAKAYTDAEKERARTAEEANTAAITALQVRDVQLTSAIAEKISHVEIVKNSVSDLQYILKVDGVDAGEINIPKDQFLKEAKYNEVSKELSFTFVTADGENTTTINIADLVDTYTAGDGLSLVDNKFAVKIRPESEPYLSVNSDGLILKGIDEQLVLKANKDNVYTKVEADAKFLSEHQSLASVATKVEVAELKDRVNDVEAQSNDNAAAILILNGNEAQVGSVKNAQKNAETYTDEAVNGEKERAIAKETILEAAIAVLNGNEAQVGSVKNAVQVSKDYTDSTLGAKANAADVYSKIEIDTKGFLTQHQDISALAAKATVDAIAANVNANKADIDALKAAAVIVNSAIDNLNAGVTRLELTAENGQGIITSIAKSPAGSTISSSLKLRNAAANILELDSDGLYANVSLSYNKATNTLTFNNGTENKEIELSETSLVRNAYYNAPTKEIIIEVSKPDGDDIIRIPAADFVTVIEVENSDSSAVSLKKVSVDGIDTLSADLVVSDRAGNLIKPNERSLYASASADDHTAHWVTEGTSEDISVQAAIDRLRSKTQYVDELVANMAEAKGKISDLEAKIENLKSATAQITTDIQTVLLRIDQCEAKVNTYDEKIATVTTQFAELQALVNGWEGRINTTEEMVNEMHEDMTEVKRQVTDESDATTIAGRMAATEYEMNNLIDFDEDDEW